MTAIAGDRHTGSAPSTWRGLPFAFPDPPRLPAPACPVPMQVFAYVLLLISVLPTPKKQMLGGSMALTSVEKLCKLSNAGHKAMAAAEKRPGFSF